MIKQPNSRQKRKFKYGFKGEGSHKRFGIGRLIGADKDGISYEHKYGSYTNEANRDNYGLNKKWQNVVHAARKWSGNKHIGSKPYCTIVNASYLH